MKNSDKYNNFIEFLSEKNKLFINNIYKQDENKENNIISSKDIYMIYKNQISHFFKN
jgi:hypothetical protein